MKITRSRAIMAHANASGKSINLKLKKLSDSKIVQLFKTVLKSSDAQDSRLWKFAGFAFNELSIRHWGKKHRKTLESFRQSIMKQSKCCLSRRSYALETAGLVDTKTKKIFHPYPFGNIASEVLYQWHNSGSKKSLQDYVSTHHKTDIKLLKDEAVRYLSPERRKTYQVTFASGYPKIGKRTPKNGEYIFALAKEQDKSILLAGMKKKGKFQHTSFFAGAPVECVGKFTIKHKKITKVRLSSGHYHPAKLHAKALVRHFEHPKNLGSRKASHIKIETHR